MWYGVHCRVSDLSDGQRGTKKEGEREGRSEGGMEGRREGGREEWREGQEREGDSQAEARAQLILVTT